MTNVNFRLFTSTILPEFDPQFVIHTGDITDGWKKGVTCKMNMIIVICSRRNRRRMDDVSIVADFRWLLQQECLDGCSRKS